MTAVGVIVGIPFMSSSARHCKRQLSQYGSGTPLTAYLSDVLTQIVNGHPNSQIDDLLPWAYAARLKPAA
ncbi:transposase IS66-like protein [Rhizobium sullae]|uniref:Transposase IS66-like protein n=1 Tax=Rhizobium sullae TaxID=50338 RepID=A0A4R3PUK5_RHISU|nr:transposase IS66-like protein [Rhizobium sullae]